MSHGPNEGDIYISIYIANEDGTRAKNVQNSQQ